MTQCYNCGIEISGSDLTREHIPAKGLFDGYSDEYKKNRLVINACFKCNNEYSICDEEFRNWIGIGSNDKLKDVISAKSAKSILRKDKLMNRLRFDRNKNVVVVSFDKKLIDDFHKKNFKGIFYSQYGVAITEEYFIHVNYDETDYSELTLSIIGYLKNNFEWKYSGHPDVFRYILQPHRDGDDCNSKDDIKVEAPNAERCYVALMAYNNQKAVLVSAMHRDYLKAAPKSTTKA